MPLALAPLAAALLAAAPACGLPALREGGPPFRPGEALAYDVALLGAFKAGIMTLEVEPPIARGTLMPLRARTRNTSIFAKLRKMRGYALSWVNVRTLLPQRYTDEEEENGVHKSTDTRLDLPGPVSMAWTRGEEKGVHVLERRGEVLDPLSAFFYLRAARLEPGREVCFDLVANRRFWRLRGALAPEPDRLETGAGTFDADRFDATLTRADGEGPERTVHLWFSRDERRLPLAAKGETDFGAVGVVLSRASSPGPALP